MQLRRFHGATIALAYGEVKAALGDDAVIVTTESTKTRAGQSTIEVVAGLPDELTFPGLDLTNDSAVHDLARAVAEATAAAPGPLAPPFVNPHAGIGLAGATSVSDGLGRGRSPAEDPFDELDLLEDGGAGDRAMPVAPEFAAAVVAAAEAGQRELLSSIADRMRSVEASLQRMAHQRANALAEEGPATLQAVRQQLIEHGVGPRVLVPLIERLAGAVRPSSTQLEATRAAERALAALLPTTPHLDASIGLGRGPLLVFVVGPHGAGKSSLAIKLAHDFRHGGAGRVLLAGIDVARAGAPQQLLAAAAAAQVAACLCYTPGDLRSLVRDETPSVVIVDTAAAAAGDRKQMLELTAFAQAAPRRATLLALPAWLGTLDALQATALFAPLGLSGLVATHVDQSASFGGIVTAAIEASTGVAYTTSSDRLTEGLAEGDNHALATALLTGAWPRVAAAAPEGALSGSRV